MLNMFTFSVAPTITTLDPLQLTVTEPDSATFTCNATARPRPTITWYTDDGSGNRTLLMNGTNYVTIMEQENGDRELISTLTISPTAPSDATDYVCVAENVVDTDEMISNLTVYGMYILYLSICNVCTCGMITPMHIIIFCMLFHTVTPMVTSVYPEVGQMNYTVNETDTVTFECSATGIPSSTITWLRNGMELNATTESRVTVGNPMEIDFPRANDGETVSVVTRTLNLINTTDDDSGMYTCMATNDADPNNDTETFEFIVQGTVNSISTTHATILNLLLLLCIQLLQ